MKNRRILLVDDTPSIHEDFRKILAREPWGPDVRPAEAALFGRPLQPAVERFELDSASNGRDAAALALAALQSGHPYAMAFVDMRMPPGWDGVDTVEQLWRIDPALQVVFCTAYSDHPWEQVMARLDVRDRLLVLKKPFELIEVAQLAASLTAKWEATRQSALQIESLGKLVEELRASENALRESHTELETLAHSLAHDLRTPLTALGSFTQLLGRELEPHTGAKARHYLQRIQVNTAMAEQLIDNLLLLEAVSRREIEREWIDIGSLARELVDELRGGDPGRQVTLNAARGLQAWADRSLTRMALKQLIANAWASTAARADARIEIGRQRGTDGRDAFLVRDNGRGFDMAHAGALFHRPQRLHAEDAPAGSGLGLVVVNRIVSRHGGAVWAESQPDAGATFLFTLPG